MRYKKALILDLDGTLIPSMVEWDELRARISRMLDVPPSMLRPLGEKLLAMPLSGEQRARALSLIEEYELRSLSRIDLRVSRSRRRLLAAARRRGFRIIVVSMRSTRSLLAALRRLGVSTMVDAVISRDQACSRKAQILMVSAMLGSPCVFFIGDMESDLEAGRAAGIPTIMLGSPGDLGRALGKVFGECLLLTSRYRSS